MVPTITKAPSHVEDLNPSPSAYKADALPDELTWQTCCCVVAGANLATPHSTASTATTTCHIEESNLCNLD